jgi:hypothetical protein
VNVTNRGIEMEFKKRLAYALISAIGLGALAV